MAAPTIDFAGFVYDDAGDAVSGAVVHIYDKNSTSTAREASSITTNSSGYWSYSHATPGEFDVEVVSGASKRRFKFDDKVHLSGIDVETLSVRGNEGALAAIYMYADEGDDASDQWRIDAGTDGVLAIGNDAASQGTFVDHITFTPNSTVANSTVAFKGGVTIAGDLTITGDDLVMGTNTSGHVLVADGTNYNPVAVSGDITIAANGAVTIANNAVETAMINADAVTGAKIADDAVVTANITDANVTLAKIANAAANTVIVRDANSSGVLSAKAVTNTQILIGDGTGFTAAALSGDATMTNAGVVAIASGVIVDADVNASAAIAISKTALVAGTNISLSTNTLNVDDAFLKNDADDTTSGIVTVGGIVLSEAKHVNISTPLLGTTDHTFTGFSVQMLAGGAISAFDLVCIHSTTSEIVKADASAYATARAIGIAPAAISDTATGTILLKGFIRDDTYNWTTGATLYLSETAGALTATAPTTDGAFVQAVGIALSPDVVYINPSMDVIEHA